jgi:hypothetical protein
MKGSTQMGWWLRFPDLMLNLHGLFRTFTAYCSVYHFSSLAPKKKEIIAL